MASPDLRRIQLANGVVLEGGVLCISHIPAQVVAAFSHNAKLPLFTLPTELWNHIASYLPITPFTTLSQHPHRIRLSADHAAQRPNALRMRPYTINSFGKLIPAGTLVPTALQLTCRALYAGYVDVLLHALRTSILFVNSADNYPALAAHMARHPAHASAVRRLEITWNPAPVWWKSYDTPFFSRIFPGLHEILVYIRELGHSWCESEELAGGYDDVQCKAFLRELMRIEGGRGVRIGCTLRTRWTVSEKVVEGWMSGEGAAGSVSMEKRKKKSEWTKEEWDRYWWAREARWLAKNGK